jgi:flagellar basal body-associated protein FliL
MSAEPSPVDPAAAAPPAEATAAKKGNPMMLVGVIVGALVAGAAAGGLLIGPRLVAGRSSAPAAKHEAAAHGKGEKKGEKGDEDHTSVYKMDNIIVNPAGSQGLHFLMVSVAIEVPDMKMQANLKAHEAELRDLAISILERLTMEGLNKPGAREQVKEDLRQAIIARAKDPSLRIYLPQFVIQ